MDQKRFEELVATLLEKLGFDVQDSDFELMKKAVLIARASQRPVKLSTLYDELSTIFFRPVTGIKTSIRNALNDAQSSKDFAKIESIMHAKVLDPACLMTTGEFISFLCEYFDHLWDGNATII